jgi:small neutral amino acid transporter SnatA (MarC family)
MNPTANLPVFLSPTRGASDAARRRMAAPFVAHGLSPRVTAIAQRLMGMILAAMAVDVMMASLRASFPGLT